MSDSLARATKTVRTFSKHGLAGALVKAGLAHYLPIHKRHAVKKPENIPEKICKAVEELGGAWIKLCQMLSLRPDIIPPEYAAAFTKLLDDVPPVPSDEIKEAIADSIGKPVKSTFANFDPRPLGSASVAQVHKARLKNGTAVAIKVLRPGVRQVFNSDIAIMRLLASHLDDKLDLPLKPSEIVDEFERYTKQELDLTKEASHIDAIRSNNTLRSIVIPKVYWSLTNKNLLVMDYLDGKKAGKLNEKDRKIAADRLIDTLLEQVYLHGVFHADLHPGNLLLLRSKKLGILDFGIIGRIDTRTRRLGLELYLAVLSQDTKKVADLLLDYGEAKRGLDREEFNRFVSRIVFSWWDTPPNKRRITHLMHMLFVLSSRKGVNFPSDCILLGKALAAAEACAKTLNPNFDYVKYSKPKVEKYLMEQRFSKRALKEFASNSIKIAEDISSLPGKTLNLVDKLSKGKFQVSLRDEQFRHLGKDLNHSSNRLSFALVAAALIVSGSLLVETGPKVSGYGVVSIVTLTLALFFVAALFVSISREHTQKYDKH